MYLYTCVLCMCIYMYVYTCVLCMCVYIYICMYIYVCIYMCTMYIYIHTQYIFCVRVFHVFPFNFLASVLRPPGSWPCDARGALTVVQPVVVDVDKQIDSLGCNFMEMIHWFSTPSSAT